MSEAKHTPGPWEVETVKTSVGICHKVGPFGLTRIGKENYACVYDDDNHLNASPELFANARLIAAAPEMLEALETFLAYDNESKHLRADAEELYEVIVRKAQAAISKAKGE